MKKDEEKNVSNEAADCSCDDENCDCGCDCSDEQGEYINLANVTEIALDEKGTVHLLVVDDNGENPQGYAVDFPTVKEAETWLKDTFGEEIFNQEEN